MNADALTRVGRQERRPLSEPNTRTPEETTAQYLLETPPGGRGINLGCGGMTFAKWLNIDVDQPHHVDIVWDLTTGLPFLPDNQFDAVFSEAFIEHVSRKAAMKIFQDCYRALRPGGHIRVAIPDLDQLLRIYRDDEKHPEANDAIRKEYGALFGTSCELFNYATRAEGHSYMYNRQEIDMLFKHVGFVDVKAVEIRKSTVPLLHNRENRPATEVSLITEGRKPG